MSGLKKTIIALLGFFYVVMLYLALNPNVSMEYRNYYISKVTNLSSIELSQLRPIEVGKIYPFNETLIGFDGWSNAENKWRWSANEKVKIVFMYESPKIPTNKLSYIAMELGSLGSQKVAIYLNGRHLSDLILNSEILVNIQITNEDLLDGKNILEFVLPGAQMPGNGDPRILAIYIKSFMVKN